MAQHRYTPAYDPLFSPDHHLADDPACRRWAWLDLCHMAAYKDTTRIVKGVVVPLKRGELLVSLRYLAERWKWSRGKVERFLAFLCLAGVDKIETVTETRAGTVYRIATYEHWALGGTSTGTPSGTSTGRSRDADGTLTGQSTEVTEVTDIADEPPSADGGAKKPKKRATRTNFPPEFEQVWLTHPRGTKKQAFEHWRKTVPSTIEQERLLRALRRYREREVSDKFLGHDLWRWIRDRRWEEQEASPISAQADAFAPSPLMAEHNRRMMEQARAAGVLE